MPAATDFERIAFYGVRLPANIVAMKKLVKKFERNTFQKLVRLAVSSIEGKTVKPEMFDSLISKSISIEHIHIVYAGVLKLIQCACRHSAAALSKEQFVADINNLGMTKDMVEDLSSAVFGSRKQVLEYAAISNVPRRATIVSFQWKIDVAISTTTLSKVLEPAVSVRMTLSNGEIKCFEMSVSKFQELRYHVASVMKEMEDLEKRSILKIQD
ncbi:COMMD5 [Bugula neritina]|uniref:COMM domain-containing protein 5 n=1 Tax=Bugula neritina TaxID=10212 RepID=A0A7J7JU96_BUGNE|nr:COMMD5 [Bugula neritina]